MKSGVYRMLAGLAACVTTPWASWHQGRIRRGGRGLTYSEMAWAVDLGLERPEQVRIQITQRVPNPLYPFFWLAHACGCSCLMEAAGITLGQGIYVIEESATSEELIAHELVHVLQYQRAGSIWAFMTEYIHQCMMNGYHDAEWEREARSESRRVLGM